MSAPQNFDPRIDLYIAKSKPFAQPILIHPVSYTHLTLPTILLV